MILPSNGGKRCSTGLPIKKIDDERQHDRTPLFDRTQSSKSRFQAGFAVTGKWFRRLGLSRHATQMGLLLQSLHAVGLVQPDPQALQT
jgi:hypothetical protein